MFTFTSYATALLALASNPQDRPIRYEGLKHERAYYHLVYVDVASNRVTASTVHSPTLTSVWNMIRPQQPSVAITGTFFAPKVGRPVAEVLVDGELKAQGKRGSVLAVDWNGLVHIHDSGLSKDFDWQEFRSGLRGAVRLIRDGKACPNPQAQGFRDRRLWGMAARTGVGVKRDGTLVLAATKAQVTLTQLARVLLSRGAVEAVSLDGGGSTMLYYRGKMVVSPLRHLNNLFVVYERSPFDSLAAANGAKAKAPKPKPLPPQPHPDTVQPLDPPPPPQDGGRAKA